MNFGKVTSLVMDTMVETENYENILPFSKHAGKLSSNTYRMKFGADHIHREIITKVIIREENAKNNYLRNIIIE